jgi:hypothetical protein
MITPLNSVLINYFAPSESEDTPNSCIVHHSDDEAVILADSHIVELSIGSKRTVNIEEIHHESDKFTDFEVTNSSVCTMTRTSQEWCRHGITTSTEQTGEKFSLTFRSVSEKFCLIILGDSNTKNINFGKGS